MGRHFNRNIYVVVSFLVQRDNSADVAKSVSSSEAALDAIPIRYAAQKVSELYS